MTLRDFRIRSATVADLGAVEALVTAAGLPTDGIADHFGERYAIAEGEGATIGTTGVEVYGASGLLRSAAVDAGWRGSGVGDALTRDRLRWAASRGLRDVWLLTTTAADYFPRFGFERVDRNSAPPLVQQSMQFSQTCCATAVAMRLVLS